METKYIQFYKENQLKLLAELLYDEKTSTWIMIQHWASAEEMKSASAKMFKDSTTEAFRGAIDPKAITINVFPTLRTWGRAIV